MVAGLQTPSLSAYAKMACILQYEEPEQDEEGEQVGTVQTQRLTSTLMMVEMSGSLTGDHSLVLFFFLSGRCGAAKAIGPWFCTEVSR